MDKTAQASRFGEVDDIGRRALSRLGDDDISATNITAPICLLCSGRGAQEQLETLQSLLIDRDAKRR